MSDRLSRSAGSSAEWVKREHQAVANSLKIRFYPFVPARARGVRIEDHDGKVYLDFIGSGGVANVGYGDARVRSAILEELDSTWTTMHCCYPSAATTELAERLIALLPGVFAKKVWFGATGSDANEALVRLLPKATGRRRLISYVGAYHGQTGGSAAISGHSAQASSIGSGNVTKMPYPDPYRCSWGPCEPDGCSLKCLEHLEEYALNSISPAEDTAAIIIEPIQSDGGDIVPPANYLPALRELCDRYGILLVFDEIKAGLGRTGTMFAFEHSGVTADAVSLGKPLGGGLPLSAVVARAEILDADLLALHTLGGAPVPAAAALAVLDVIESDDLLTNARERGEQILDGLRMLAKRHPIIGDVRGRGLMIGVELVRDLDTKAPATPEAAQLVYRCFELGLLVIYCGLKGNVIEMTPPLTITSDDVEEMLSLFDQAVTDIEDGNFDRRKVDNYAGW